MCKRIVIGIDAGKFDLKGKSKHGEFVFNTKYSLNHIDQAMLDKRTYNVTIGGAGGKKLTIGNGGMFNDKNEGKATDVHIWSTLTAIGLLRGEATEIVLIYGESFNAYRREEQRELIKQKLEGDHSIIINGTEHNFKITLCHVVPEGMGHILQDLKSYQGVQYSLDWGGTTVIFMQTYDGVPQFDKCGSFLLGVNNIIGIIGLKLSQRGLGNHQEIQIEQWVKNGCPNKNIQEVIDECISAQLLQIDSKLGALGINLHEYLEVTFIGGTSTLLSTQIKKHYACASIYKDSPLANVRGMYEYGRLKYGE